MDTNVIPDLIYLGWNVSINLEFGVVYDTRVCFVKQFIVSYSYKRGEVVSWLLFLFV